MLGVRKACFATSLLCDPEQVTVSLWASDAPLSSLQDCKCLGGRHWVIGPHTEPGTSPAAHTSGSLPLSSPA